MTREEIERSFQYNMTDAFIKWDKAVNAEYKEENEEAFYQGAYASQKYLIKKACEWLKENMYIEHIFEYDDDEEPVQYVCASVCDSVDEFVNNFRKAMGEK